MKKCLFSLSGIMMAFVVSFSLISCSSDSVDDNLEEILKANVWQADANYDLMEWGDNLSYSKEYVKLFFLGNGSGIGKSYTKEIDTYFGESSTTVPFAFSYSVSGSSVRINNTTYSYKNGSLVTQEGKVAFTKASYTNSDREWLETARYYAMSDKDRLNLNFVHGCNVDAKTYENTYMITLFLNIPASEHAHSRYISSIEAQYSIKDGKFTSSKNPECVLLIYEDKEYTASTTAFVSTTSQATITASFYYFDSKNKKKMYAGSATYSVPGDYNDDGDDNGDDNGDNGDNEGGNDSEELSGIIQGHEYVNLGLPSGTLWATCNVGAEKPEDYGDYFAWGETTGYMNGKTMFNWSTYKYCKGSDTSITKYCTDSAYGTVDGYSELLPSDDAATTNWGTRWQMPSIEQLQELISNTHISATSTNGIHGFSFESKNNGMKIFLPVAGYRKDTSLTKSSSVGLYLTRSLFKDYSNSARRLHISWGLLKAEYDVNYGSYRSYGQSIRPVVNRN